MRLATTDEVIEQGCCLLERRLRPCKLIIVSVIFKKSKDGS